MLSDWDIQHLLTPSSTREFSSDVDFYMQSSSLFTTWIGGLQGFKEGIHNCAMSRAPLPVPFESEGVSKTEVWSLGY